MLKLNKEMRDPKNKNRLTPIAHIGYGKPKINAYQKVKSTGKTVPRYIRRELWSFQCTCGEIIIREIKEVKRDQIKSCGCLSREVKSKQLKKLHREGRVRYFEKGHKSGQGQKRGTPAHNRGKIFVKDFPNRRYSTGKFMELEELQELWSLKDENCN